MPRLSEIDRHRALGLLQARLPISEVSLYMNVNRTTIFRLRQRLHETDTASDRPRSGRPRSRCTTQRQDRNLVRNHMNNSVTDTNVRYGPSNTPRGIASNGEMSYSVTNLDSALTMLMAEYVYGEETVKDTKQIALGNRTGDCRAHLWLAFAGPRSKESQIPMLAR
ncbi:transposable element Tcb2 transposase [Elysia marginata]|uniref:Transposable element Tcb2 transposase n=1 Tax=Elysia marginata TaxID=1093978 RepID=A0AAV4HLQ5_9GAST|nr:transposable element Tcb2 transposase [Elysia marginata]